MYAHIVIKGTIYRIVQLEAGDTREASKHVSAQRPIGFTTAAEFRRAAP